MKSKQTSLWLALLLGVSLGFAACDDDDAPTSGGGDEGTVNLGVTDAPVDEATRVVVQFTGVQVQPAEGQRIDIGFDSPRQVDLLALQGSDSELLLAGETLPAGNYQFVRLQVDAQRDTLDSFIEFNDGSQVSLFIPSGSQTGLQLSGGFTVAANGESNFTVDFDLRKSITNPQGQPDYFLRPSLRLVDNATVGHIAGMIDPLLVTDDSCSNQIASDTGNAVYLFTGSDATPDDIGSAAEPESSAIVRLDDSNGLYSYKIGFVSAGNYTVAFTCQALDDDPEADEEIAFGGQSNVTVTAGSTATANIGSTGATPTPTTSPSPSPTTSPSPTPSASPTPLPSPTVVPTPTPSP